MLNSANAKLQKLAVANHVPAWNVYVDRRRPAFWNESDEYLTLLGKNGNEVFRIQKTAYSAWGRMEESMKAYAATDECKNEWLRYVAEGLPVCGLLGMAL